MHLQVSMLPSHCPPQHPTCSWPAGVLGISSRSPDLRSLPGGQREHLQPLLSSFSSSRFQKHQELEQAMRCQAPFQGGEICCPTRKNPAAASFLAEVSSCRLEMVPQTGL